MDRFYARLPLPLKMQIQAAWLAGRLGLGQPMSRVFLYGMAADLRRAKKTGWRSVDLTDDDIVVTTYPKSGTNWMMQIAQQTLRRGEAEFDHIHDVIPWPDAPLPSLPEPRPSAGPRVIKTHCELDELPFSPDARYLLIIRDPKDVFVSSYHFVNGVLNGLLPCRLTPQDWLAKFMGPKPLMGCWAAHTASWWSVHDRPNVLPFTFRQMKADLPGTVDAVCEFAGLSLTTAERQAVIVRSGFPWMKAHEPRFRPPIPAPRGSAAKMLRSGKVGERGLISPAEFARIDQFFMTRLEQLGSDFPYAEHFPLA